MSRVGFSATSSHARLRLYRVGFRWRIAILHQLLMLVALHFNLIRRVVVSNTYRIAGSTSQGCPNPPQSRCSDQ